MTAAQKSAVMVPKDLFLSNFERCRDERRIIPGRPSGSVSAGRHRGQSTGPNPRRTIGLPTWLLHVLR